MSLREAVISSVSEQCAEVQVDERCSNERTVIAGLFDGVSCKYDGVVVNGNCNVDRNI